ncbi:hypothetical protein PFISCL1PPCAC_20935, partial [Pristionchus fissidentatus]
RFSTHQNRSMNVETVIRWEVDNVSTLTTERRSPIHTITDLPWFISAFKECSNRTGNAPHLAVFIECNEESECDLWRVEHESTIVLINQQNPENTLRFEPTGAFDKEKSSRGKARFILMSKLFDSSKGFIKEDKIILEAHIVVKSVMGVRKSVKFDFTDSSGVWHKTALIIEGEKVYVCKPYLALHSPVFASMFFGDFAEKNKEEIELKDVSREEFVELLNLIYPSSKSVTVNSYKYLLVLADPFQVKLVTDNVENYLIKTEKVAVAAKLLLADQYKLELLKTHCFNSFEHPRDIKVLEGTDECGQFSDAMINCLFKKVLAIID